MYSQWIDMDLSGDEWTVDTYDGGLVIRRFCDGELCDEMNIPRDMAEAIAGALMENEREQEARDGE